MADAALCLAPAVTRPGLDGLRSVAGPDLERVEQVIAERLEAGTALIPRLSGHIARAGGKRLRPILTLVCARLCGAAGDRPVALAASVEVFHMATLLHDDVVDGSALRRGVASANAVWDNRSSVLVGDYLIGRAFQLMIDAGPPGVLELFVEATSAMAEGELRQMQDAGRPEAGAAACLEAIEGKTAALFAAACRLGAVAAGASHEAEMALGGYGRNLGIAFQLVDDVLDWSGREAELGKTVGDDFAEGKATLPVILAYERGDAEERSFWRRTFRKGDRRPGDFEQALLLLKKRQALADTLVMAGGRAKEAAWSLDMLPNGPERRALHDFAAFCVERRH